MHIGLADFADPTLLILGTEESFYALADIVEKRQPTDLGSLNFIQLVNVGFVVGPTSNAGSLRRSGGTFNWKISTEEAAQFSEKIRALAGHQGPAHIYLDPHLNAAGVQILASKAEYSADAVFAIK